MGSRPFLLNNGVKRPHETMKIRALFAQADYAKKRLKKASSLP
jgi:hypothetical protein